MNLLQNFFSTFSDFIDKGILFFPNVSYNFLHVPCFVQPLASFVQLSVQKSFFDIAKLSTKKARWKKISIVRKFVKVFAKVLALCESF
jgi:hypothetical protein